MPVEENAEVVGPRDDFLGREDVLLLWDDAGTLHLVEGEYGIVARMVRVVTRRAVDGLAIGVVDSVVVGNRQTFLVDDDVPQLRTSFRNPGPLRRMYEK
jgi:hypothetical protein